MTEDRDLMPWQDPEHGWELAGRVGIDAGTIYVGEPLLPMPDEWGNELYEEHPNDQDGRWGSAGITVSTGYGDGCYPVWVQIDEASGRVVGLHIDFMDEEVLDWMTAGLKALNDKDAS